MSQVATNGVNPPKIVTAAAKLNVTPIPRIGVGKSSASCDGSTPLWPASTKAEPAGGKDRHREEGIRNHQIKTGSVVRKKSQAVPVKMPLRPNLSEKCPANGEAIPRSKQRDFHSYPVF
jgi:hypothetical protein